MYLAQRFPLSVRALVCYNVCAQRKKETGRQEIMDFLPPLSLSDYFYITKGIILS